MTKIYAPNRQANGVAAGVQFKDGVAETDDHRALAYFARAGYGIGEYKPPPGEASAVDARDVSQPIPLGTRLRDAAVDPRASDFLPPTNAGDADPHGLLVVSPQLHASETGPIRPGPVAVDHPRQQSAEEMALDHRAFVEQEPAPTAVQPVAGPADVTVSQPGAKATKADWVDYAVARGLSRDEAEDMTRAAIQKRFEETP